VCVCVCVCVCVPLPQNDKHIYRGVVTIRHEGQSRPLSSK
jgi:hypothetical protein